MPLSAASISPNSWSWVFMICRAHHITWLVQNILWCMFPWKRSCLIVPFRRLWLLCGGYHNNVTSRNPHRHVKSKCSWPGVELKQKIMTQINTQTNISSSKRKLPTELRALKAELQILQLTLWFFLCLKDNRLEILRLWETIKRTKQTWKLTK